MKDLNRFVTKKYAADWKDIGLELNLKLDILKNIQKNNQKVEDRFEDVLDKWLKLAPKATWRMLEAALTNVRRQQLGLDPVDDVNGKITLGVMLFFTCTILTFTS